MKARVIILLEVPEVEVAEDVAAELVEHARNFDRVRALEGHPPLPVTGE